MSRIFLVEDHDVVRRTLKELLESEADFVVCGEASNGVQALEMLEAANPDLVVIDVSLPKMDGLTLLTIIKQRWPYMKCVILSGHATSAYAEQALQAGALNYIFKDDVYNVIPAVQEALKA